MSFRDQRFSRYNRLTTPSEFRDVFTANNRVVDGNFVTLFRDNKLDVARLGLVVSRRNVKLASRRNRLKRVIRESFRKHKDDLTGRDVVVIIKKNIQTGNRSMLERSLSYHWEQIQNA